jgi:hypothetical protein
MPDAVAQTMQHGWWWCRERLVWWLRCCSLPIPHVLLPQPSICFRETFWATGSVLPRRHPRHRRGYPR